MNNIEYPAFVAELHGNRLFKAYSLEALANQLADTGADVTMLRAGEKVCYPCKPASEIAEMIFTGEFDAYLAEI